MKRLFIFCFFLFVFFFIPLCQTRINYLISSELAVDSSYIVINEIAWMGTETSYNDEWIELYNNSSSDLELEGWKLITEDGTPTISLVGKILAREFFILERTDDKTLPSIEANLIYKGALGNQGESLKLINPLGEIVDKIDCSSGWFTGDNLTKQTMERINPLVSGNTPDNWQTSQRPGGSPKAQNSKLAEVEPLPISEPEPKPEPEIQYPSGIVINEILPSPEGPDAEEEWIEIFNQSNKKINLSNWQITDAIGKTKLFTFSEETVIEAKGYLVLDRPTTKITLNNSGDGLNLLQPNGNVVDTIAYEKAPRGKSYSRTNNDWAWNSFLTPGSKNILSPLLSSQQESQEKTEIESLQPLEGEFSSGFQAEKEMATISKAVHKSLNSLAIFLIALVIASFSGIIILFLRKKMNPK